MSSTQGSIGAQESDGIIGGDGLRGTTMNDTLHTMNDRLRGVIAPLRKLGDMSPSQIIIPALAMTGACLAVVTTASVIKRGSPWAGINSIAAGLGLTAVRPSRHFDPVVTLGGIGAAIGGSVLLAGIHGLVSRQLVPRLVGNGRVGGSGSRVLGGVMTSLAAVMIDKLFMRDALFPAFANALGVRGTVLKYGAIGAAAALASRRSVS